MSKQIEIPKYVLYGNQNIPEDLKTILDYFLECGNKDYQVCLVAEKESISKNLKDQNYQGKEFIHFDNQNLKTIYFFLPVKIRNAIKRLNKLVSNPENDFNKTLGIHTIGLVPIDEIQALNDLGYGLSLWNTIKVYASTTSSMSVTNKSVSDNGRRGTGGKAGTKIVR